MPKAAKALTIRDRLRMVGETCSQSEMARRTGIAQPTVANYIAGRPIPAHFCARLCAAFGINPAWLLLGQGDMFAYTVHARVQAVVAHIGEALDELIRIMRTRLRALQADGLYGLLAESDRLRKETEQVCASLSSQVVPMCRGLLETAYQLIRNGKPEIAISLIRVQVALARLSFDPRTRSEAIAIQGIYAAALGDMPGAFAIAGTAAGYRVASQPTSLPVIFDDLGNVVGLAMAGNRPAFGDRFARANIHAYAGTGMAGDEGYLTMIIDGAVCGLALGSPADSVLRRVARAWTMLGTATHGKRTQYVACLLACGLLSAREMAGADHRGLAKMREPVREFLAITIQRHAAFAEDPHSLREVQKVYLTHTRQGADRRHMLAQTHTQALLDALAGRHRWAIRRMTRDRNIRALLASADTTHHLHVLAALCQIHRLGASHAQARTLLLEAQTLIDGREQGMLDPLATRALHYRNALLLIAPTERDPALRRLRDGAQDFFMHRLTRRYNGYRGVSAILAATP